MKVVITIRGIVVAVGKVAEMIVVQHNDGFSVVELFGDIAEKDDIISGNLDSEGTEDLYNVTRNEKMTGVIIQACFSTFEQAHRMISR